MAHVGLPLWNNPMRVLITGISGYLGQHLARVAANKFSVVGTYFNNMQAMPSGIESFRLDITNLDEVTAKIAQIAPNAIIHTAALNNGNDSNAFDQINTQGSGHIARAAQKIGARLIHISTDTVHDGRNGPYSDCAKPSPVNAYGRSKAAAEGLVMQLCLNTVIVRTSLIYDSVALPRSTANFAAMLQQGETVRLFSDVQRQPVHRDFLARALLILADSDYRGYLNIAGSQSTSREHYERALMKYWNIDTRQQVTSILAETHAPSVPRDLRLSIDKAKRILGLDAPGFDQSLGLINNNSAGNREQKQHGSVE